MWTIVVAGHLYLLNGQPVSTPDQRACQELAARLHGQCVQEEAEALEQWVPPEVTPGMPVPEPVAGRTGNECRGAVRACRPPQPATRNGERHCESDFSSARRATETARH